MNATECNLTTCTAQWDHTALDSASRGGLPFVIPKNGDAVAWHRIARWQGPPAPLGS
jgi:hypothetical protein